MPVFTALAAAGAAIATAATTFFTAGSLLTFTSHSHSVFCPEDMETEAHDRA